MLPALSWAVAHLVPSGPLRDGVLAAGLAPCEIASVATTALAGGEAAVAAGVLIGSTLATVALAAPILTLEAGSVRFSADAALVAAPLLATSLASLFSGVAVSLEAAAVAKTGRGGGSSTGSPPGRTGPCATRPVCRYSRS